MSKAIGTANILPVLGKYKSKVMKMSRESVAQTQLEKKIANKHTILIGTSCQGLHVYSLLILA